MVHSTAELTQKLLDSYQRYYNITLYEDGLPLQALCEYYEQSEKYVVSRKANLWTAKGEEFIFLYEMPILTMELFQRCLDEAVTKGRAMAHIGPGHMYTYITPVFVCEKCEPDALKALKKCRIHKLFRFSLHGWLDVRLAACQVASGTIDTNRTGRDMEKQLKAILFS